jgi:archaellum component FlaD/FlaE
MAGIIEILNSGKGHDELKLPDDKAEAKKKVQELLDKRYTIFVKVTTGEGDAKKEEDHKVDSYDEATGEYVIKQTVTEQKELRVLAASATATAVAPTAGG